MILSDKTLKKLIDSGDLTCEPITENSIQPASIDCRLGRHFLVVDETQSNSGVLTFDKEIHYREIENDSIVIAPHSFLLATTMEHIKLPSNFSAFVEGRSSVGRMGLFIQNAGWVDAGFEGKITLELYNANSLPIKLEAGRRICQLVFCTMDQASERPYNGKYQGQTKSVGSRIFKDTET
jgi:dCTP deaminase